MADAPISSKWYDRLKPVALVYLPAFSALYYGLGLIWGFPKVEEVVGSVAVLDAFLGTVLGLSSKVYKQNSEEGHEL